MCPCSIADTWGAHAAANMQKLAAAREAHVGEVEYELRVAREDVAELRARLGRQQEERCGGGAGPDPSPASAGGGRRGDEAGSGALEGAGRDGDAEEEHPPGMPNLAHAPGSGGGDGVALSTRCAWAWSTSQQWVLTVQEAVMLGAILPVPWLARCLAPRKIFTRASSVCYVEACSTDMRSSTRAGKHCHDAVKIRSE